MKKITLYLLVAFLFFGPSLFSLRAQSVKLRTVKDSASYSLGIDIGYYFKALQEDREKMNVKAMMKGLEDVVYGHPGKWEREAAYEFLRNYYNEYLPSLYLTRSEAWLDSVYQHVPDVQRSESGLLYQIVRSGNDRKPEGKDTIVTSYKAYLINGEAFDEHEDGEIFEFTLGRIIKGWSEGMQYIGEGGKIKLWIHPDLAYGKTGSGRIVKANEALYYEVELKEVKKVSQEESDISPGEDISDGSSFTGSSDMEFYTDGQAGDYTRVFVPAYEMEEIEEGENGEYVYTVFFTYKGKNYKVGYGGIYLQDGQGEYSIAFPFSTDELNKQYYPVIDGEIWGTVFTPRESFKGPDLFVITCNFFSGKTNLVYTLDENTGHLTKAGEIPFVVANDWYDTAVRISDEMEIYQDGKGIRIMFSYPVSHVFPFYFYGHPVVFSGQDIWYELQKGKLNARGPALALTYFRQLEILKHSTGNRLYLLDSVAIGDMNGDGETDMACYRRDGNRISLLICKNGKVNRTIFLPVEPGSRIYSISGGLLEIITPEGESRYYFLQDEELILMG